MMKDHVSGHGTTLSVLWQSKRSRMAATRGPSSVVQRKGNARRACQKAMMASTRVVFALNPPDKGASKDFLQNKGRGKDQKGKGKQGINPQSRFSASETPNEEGYGQAWESDDWSAGLQMLGGSAQRLILHGWWQPS